ncbi:aldose 1-epimerase family protein [Gelidibacter sp.]|uniref:aldose 1-epimerase family protein n=1 Tax=Gelidibacter sp. TaxID=2018083 RepID=UPI002D196DE7|nr:aldose 1-epimerase family protein [Gelidibacter sp.]HUH27338.1 aldose 1-epimerase family protein [Gelidibacter sp.]
MFILKNSLLEIAIHPIGAELQKISAVKNDLEFMWDGNPEIWSGHAPNLFPIVGELKDGRFTYKNKSYHLSRHGFARRSDAFVVDEKSENHLSLKMTYSEATLLNYPFKFEFLVSYALVKNRITITYTVRNIDDKTIYFSIGGHPAFKCPVYPEETYEEYSLQFEHPETSPTHLLNVSTGLFTSETEAVFKTPGTIPLHTHLFDKDALVFKDLKSKQVSLHSKNHGEILNFNFEDFPFLGIWAKPNAKFVCIEPWQGLADSEDSIQVLKDKEGIVALEKNKTYSASYSIEIHERHLV